MMPARKEGKTWSADFYYTDSIGVRKRKHKRGFETKKAALEWERQFLMQTGGDMEMDFASYAEVYLEDIKPSMKNSTWQHKHYYINASFLPFFGKRRMCDIQAKDVLAWQKYMIEKGNASGKPYKPGYLKTLHNQLSAMFNHAIRFYGLKEILRQKREIWDTRPKKK